jgi:transposase InsO family protein
MPWQARALMDVKREFVELASQEGANRRELCRRFGISPSTGYALLARWAGEGHAGLQARSRRPLRSPGRSETAMEQRVVALRQEHPAWGGRKIARRLRDLGVCPAPAPSTVTSILHRHGLIGPTASEAATPWQRFEHEQPNALWQIDFKGDFATASAQRCHTLALLDDHSRFNLALQACADVATEGVRSALRQAFQRYGLPARIQADNGAPWGTPRAPGASLSALQVWLLRLGVKLGHSSPYHPQSNGKVERFHRSVQREVLHGRVFVDLAHTQRAFEHWRVRYNFERPHDALGLHTPATRYRPSARAYSDTLAPIEYPDSDTVCVVGHNGVVRFRGRQLRLPSALLKLPVAFRADVHHEDRFEVYFCHHLLMQLDLRAPQAPLS